MTTLPQTTNIRLPRPMTGGMQLAQGGPGGALGQVSGQGGTDVWRVIRANLWWILVVVFVLSPAVGFGVNEFLKRKFPKFTATGVIEVQDRVDPNAMVRGGQSYTDVANIGLEIRTQAKKLQSEGLKIKILTNPNSEIRNKTRWFKQFKDMAEAKQDFEDNLRVVPLQDTKLVQIDFTNTNPEDCRTIVQELVSTHLEEQRQLQTMNLLDRTQMLNTVRIKGESRMRDLDGEMKELQIKLNTDGGSIGRVGIKEIELSKLVGERIEADFKAQKARNFYESMFNAMNNGNDPALVDEIAYKATPYLMTQEATVKMYEDRVEEIKLLYGEENPRYKAELTTLERKRKAFTEDLNAARAKARISIIEQLKSESDELVNKAEGIGKKVENMKNDLGDLSNQALNFLNKQEEQRALREQLKNVKEQIENVMALSSSQSSAKVAWAQMPEIPRNRSFPKLPVTMALAIALGLALSVGIAFLREIMDQSIRSPRDIARIGQIGLLGVIPNESDDPQSAGARLPVVIFDAPHSIMADSFRQMRTKLQHTASLDTTRSIMVTSPSPGDGKTTVACNLAAGLALNGRRILLVDANFRRPEVNKVFGLSNEQGFSDVLNAVAAFDEVIQETQVPNLAVMSAGPKPMNPTELFESQLLVDFIERALEEFDHVIFDTGPLMVVAEAQAMAPRVDGVISVVRAKTNNRGLLQRMRDDLRRVKAEHLGVVLNAVASQRGGYYRRNIQTYYDYANGQS
jgi:polysaccharide biosynthesis transport protein